jgi:hypothetical protein
VGALGLDRKTKSEIRTPGFLVDPGMKKQISLALLGASLLFGSAVVAYRSARASDHDDGETDSKARALNLSDHFAFRTPGSNGESMTLVMYFNPRSLPGYSYFMSTQARYEFHVSRAADKAAAPTGSDDVVIRFEAEAPDAAGVQAVTMTVLRDGEVVATSTGATTAFAASKAGDITVNEAAIDGKPVKWFIGARQDSFHFDVIRFFQIRAFLAGRFFGGADGNGDPTAGLANNCRGDNFLALLGGGLSEYGGVADHDVINLWNPPSCAPDFTKDYNVTSITIDVPVAALQANNETVFDTWSTIAIPQ